ncbi:BTB/POZ protein [Nemania serpens]|nr:BTB/POZ protein [Nemania serpens]
MANFTSIGPKLLESGDYSDFTLVCEDQKFRVHKSIVCAQCPVFAAATKGGFKEAETNTFHVVDFKPVTLKCMLQYMYTGKYEEKPHCCPNDNVQEPSQENDNDDSTKNISERWIHHGLVNCIADFFRLPELAKMSVATLDEITQKDWSANAFCDLLYATLGKTGDQGFHLLLATRAADHIDHLTAMGLFNGSDLSNELAPAFLRICVQRLNALQAELVGDEAPGEGSSSFILLHSGLV